MLREIIGHAIGAQPDMTLIDDLRAAEGDAAEDLAPYASRHRIDVMIFTVGDAAFTPERIDALLNANPRLGLLELDGARDRGVLHHLTPAHDPIRQLAQPSLAEAIRAGAALRRRA